MVGGIGQREEGDGGGWEGMMMMRHVFIGLVASYTHHIMGSVQLTN